MIFRFLCMICFSLMSFAKLNVVTSTTDLKWAVEKIGGDKVIVESLLLGTEDPHFIDAMPHFVGKLASADMFCLVGLDLEIGWAPKILSRSGNKNVQQGGKGYCETGRSVKALNVPVGRVDRSLGDVHPMGNPHYHLGPKAFLQGSETILNTLINIDTKNAEYYLANFEKLKLSMSELTKKIQKILVPIKALKFMEYHREYTYFLKEFDLVNNGAIEAVPGVPPSAGRLARVAIQAKQAKVAAAFASNTSPKKLTDKFQQMSGVPVARVPLSIVKSSQFSDYEKLLTFIAQSIVQKIKK